MTVQELAKTTARSWGESDIALKEPIEYSDKDSRGPLNLAVAITVRNPTPPTPPTPSASPAPAPDASKKEGRIVAIGDSNFGSNGLLTFQANQDLFMNMVSWLAQDSDLISIRPKEQEDRRLNISGQKMNMLFWLSVVIFPLAVVSSGLAVWWKRR